MKPLFIIAIILSPLICYLEWGSNQSSFLYEIEFNLFFNNKDAAGTLTHPAIFIPMLGQMLFLSALFHKKYARKLIIAGISFTGLLVLLILFIGLWVTNIKMVVSTLPFIAVSIFYFAESKNT